jgi:hypothetical protein
MIEVHHNIYKICECIIKSNIKNVNYKNIIELNLDDRFNKEYLLTFDIKTRIFKKLVVYGYCFQYKINNITNKELVAINNYILNKKNDLIYINNFDLNMLEFIKWCKIMNSTKKEKIQFISEYNKNRSFE